MPAVKGPGIRVLNDKDVKTQIFIIFQDSSLSVQCQCYLSRNFSTIILKEVAKIFKNIKKRFDKLINVHFV